MNKQHISWVEKYRPTKFEEVRGQNEALHKIIEFTKNFSAKARTKKALILHGAPGTGKTTMAHVIANETNSEIFELNASDIRNKEKIQEILRPAIEQRSLIKSNKIILIDEADGISGYYDRGGVPEIISIITESPYPLIITANDIWSKKLSDIRKKGELVELKEIDYKTIIDILFNILRKENLFVNENIIKSIATRAKGDLRAAINDLQSISRLQDPSVIVLDERNKEIDIFNALKMVFKGKPTADTLKIFDSVNMDIDEIILWMEENITKEYTGKDLARAYELLAEVDVFRGRIHKQQYWRFMVYEYALLSYGIAAAKTKTNTNFTSYKKPSRILKIWLNNQRSAKKKSISEKYSNYVHVGLKRAMSEFPIIKQILKSNTKIQDELKLSEDELAYLYKE